jgi:hypothetical protein
VAAGWATAHSDIEWTLWPRPRSPSRWPAQTPASTTAR